ncbi:MAG: SRPBCC family protein [Longimicrobiales bacterium]
MQKSTEARGAVPETRSAEGQIAIDATPDRVWQALTDARELERWFPLDARVEPGEGGSIWMSWRNEFAASMRIEVWDPPYHLRTAWSFNEGESTGQVTDYWIEAKGGRTIVRAVTSGFPLDASWDGWVEGTRRGWAFELRSLKQYLERHSGESRHVAYLRWRVPLSAQEAWARLAADQEAARWLSAGQVFDHRPTGQYATVLSDPADALLRLSIEPGAPGGPHEVVLWLSAWGGHERRVRAIENEWAQRLAHLFPEGAAP